MADDLYTNDPRDPRDPRNRPSEPFPPGVEISSTTPLVPGSLRRISWGAIIAGAVVATVSYMLLSLLGLAIGLGSVHPTQPGGFEGLGTATGIWVVLSGLVSLFAGGWVAGRLAGAPKKTDAALHGVVTWGVATLVTVWMLTTAVGAVVGGAFGLAGQGVSAVSPTGEQSALGGLLGPEFERDARLAIREQVQSAREAVTTYGDDPATRQPVQAQLLSRHLGEAGQSLQSAASDVQQDPQRAEQHLARALDGLMANMEGAGSAVDRNQVVSALAQQTGMSRPEAEQTVDAWLAPGRTDLNRQLLEGRARQIGEDVAGAVSRGALWAFVSMALGLGAALIGGLLGVRRDIPVATTRTATY